ncbi:geranylgeranyl transferase type-2 subunit alpha-like [Dendronephthya gigantea]|uniref:geranylgeranyl transferase type-2 subunit alpha-like n=1 Tax=Dendronephthya gigantea TaxID=151771 RepID=UPI001068E5A6|nr:geranylgeranyl transferase type-2 subunit alpha-like [Dendronephthya gigantea]
MHGRIKVRTTAEQAEAKRKEREKKLEVYQKVTSKVNAKRKNGELDEEALSLTGQLLHANPDFYSLWNYRREVLEHLKNERETTQLKEFCVKELSFLESCLPVNPKSYGIWHHRSWIMLFMPEPDWKKELHLCTVYLSYDERNFHCWDYRRFVVKQAKISAQEEFEFTSNKIRENFSNYSSWHYRSKLLPKIHPARPGDTERIEEQALLKEFQLVQNAFFTDPNDQSAWFYHRWLLGRARNELGMILAYARRSDDNISVCLLYNQPVKRENLSSVMLKLNEVDVNGDWFNPFANSLPSSIWIARLNFDSKETVHLAVSSDEMDVSLTLKMELSVCEKWLRFSDQIQYVFRSELTAVHHSFLENELESCELLLEEEPDNKWTILTIVLLMRAINPMKYAEKVESYLERLCGIDYYRKEYYIDLDSKYKLENTIEKHLKEFKEKENERSRTIQLTNMKLSYLSHMEQLLLMTHIDLSGNKIRHLDDCNMLRCARNICADNNQLDVIVRQGILNLPCLQELSLKNNNIHEISCLNVLKGCRNLKILNLQNNPIENLLNWRQEVKAIIPWLEKLNCESL